MGRGKNDAVRMQAMVPLCAAVRPVRIDENTAGRVREERMIMSENGIVQHDGSWGELEKETFFSNSLSPIFGRGAYYAITRESNERRIKTRKGRNGENSNPSRLWSPFLNVSRKTVGRMEGKNRMFSLFGALKELIYRFMIQIQDSNLICTMNERLK